jgi:hypothetical protein
MYNGLVDKYNESSPEDKKKYGDIVQDYYNKFSEMTGSVSLQDLKFARQRYDDLYAQYQDAMSQGLSFEKINSIYQSLKISISYLNAMSDKYVDLENGRFGWTKNKNDADVTIDDVDSTVSINTSLGERGGKKAIVDSSFALLSKGMRERIARKLAGKTDNGIDQEQQEFINYSIAPPNAGLGSVYTNPLVARNKEYERKQYLNCKPNPKGKITPSMNVLVRKSKQPYTRFHNPVQIDDQFNYDSGNKMINQKLYEENPTPKSFHLSRLYNPEYHLEQINNIPLIQTNSDIIGRRPPYYGLPLTENQNYQYGNIQYDYNERFNNYPNTMIISKPINIKARRSLPNSYSLK